MEGELRLSFLIKYFVMHIHKWVFTSKDIGVSLDDLFRKFCIEHGIEFQSSCGEETDCVVTPGLPAAMKQEKQVLTIKQIDTGFELLTASIAALEARVAALEAL